MPSPHEQHEYSVNKKHGYLPDPEPPDIFNNKEYLEFCEMKYKASMDPNRLIDMIYYKDGNIYLKYNNRKLGSRVGPRAMTFTFNNYSYIVARLVWELHNGPLKNGQRIIHINGISYDDRIENLELK